MKRTIVVNLFGGPGTGKSTGATAVFSALKKDGIDAEYVSEFAKDKVWERNGKVFQCQMYVTGKQLFKISRCIGEVDVVITDSPVLMGVVYAQDDEPLKAAIVHEAKQFDNVNVFLKRVKPYNPNGRFQTEEEAKKLDGVIYDLLKKSGEGYFVATADDTGYKQVTRLIEQLLEEIKFEDDVDLGSAQEVPVRAALKKGE